MLNIIKSFFNNLYSLLPDSPFQALFSDFNFDQYKGWINFFIPFDLCFKFTELWLAGIAAYYLFCLIKKIVFDLIINKLLA